MDLKKSDEERRKEEGSRQKKRENTERERERERVGNEAGAEMASREQPTPRHKSYTIQVVKVLPVHTPL